MELKGSNSCNLAASANISAYVSLLEDLGVAILDPLTGFVECPGTHLHTTPTADSHCTLYHNADGTLRFHCFHQSCADERHRAGKALRALVSGTPKPKPISPAALKLRRERERALQEAEAELLQTVLHDFAWPAVKIEADPRGRVGEPLAEQWIPVLCLFEPNDVVWVGRDLGDTGKLGHRWRFRTSEDWLNGGRYPGRYICPNAFLPGVHSRSERNVAKRCFLVVESDDPIVGRQVGAVFRFLESEKGMRLRAVVDTGGKSLHGWFEYPDPNTIKGLRNLLRVLKCDLKMFGASQPCRLPGSVRGDTGRPQRLIYFPLD
jgi:hypothetical protein